MQAGVVFCILDMSYLLLLGNPESQVCAEFAQARNSDRPLSYFCVPDMLSSPSFGSLSLPDDIQLILSLVSGTNKSIQPHNAILSYWNDNGLKKDVAWQDVGRILLQHDSFMSARTVWLYALPWPSLQPEGTALVTNCHN
jgi:hypothetical protein